jgi:hypothetical protein
MIKSINGKLCEQRPHIEGESMKSGRTEKVRVENNEMFTSSICD